MAKQIEYNPAVIHQFAARLYARANSIVAVYTLLGVLLGGAVLLALGAFSGKSSGGGELLIVVVLCGGIGYALGAERALVFRQQAQLLMCQVSIENNTRQLLWLAQTHLSGPVVQAGTTISSQATQDAPPQGGGHLEELSRLPPGPEQQ
jgi:hypothetical protein